jgi:hypothetical protein
MHDSIPATRKSLTEFQITEAMTAQVPPDSGNTDIPSGPPILSQMPATLASTPLTTGAVIDRLPDVKIIEAGEVARVAKPGSAKKSTFADLAKQNAIWIVGGVALSIGAGAVVLRQRQVSPAPTTAESASSQPLHVIAPEASKITLRATVTPPDARIFVDGHEEGGAGDSIYITREKKEHAVRIERKGYIPQTMWVVTDADRQLGPITLTEFVGTAGATASASASNKKPTAAPSGKPATTKTKLNKDLLKPKELGGTKK